MLQLLRAKFDRKMYELICSNKCIDSKRILGLFCDEPVKKIQHAWLRHRQWKRNRASQTRLGDEMSPFSSPDENKCDEIGFLHFKEFDESVTKV